jgi:hypothetical protein
VAGQLRAADGPPTVAQNPAKAGGHGSKKQEVLREAGTREGCLEATDASPPVQCASPIQVFLVPLAAPAATPRPYASYADVQRATGVLISFPPPKLRDETWTLRAPGGVVVCQVPCQAWVGPVSGYYMQREPRSGTSAAILHLPQSFAHPVGSRVVADYQALRGNPSLARPDRRPSSPRRFEGTSLVHADARGERHGADHGVQALPDFLVRAEQGETLEHEAQAGLVTA